MCVVYIGLDNMVIIGCIMDWKEDIQFNLYFFFCGIKWVGYNKGNMVEWILKYGSIVVIGYDIGICDGMNEKGLVVSLLFLLEFIYVCFNDICFVMGISIWMQYVLDNFVMVSEVVEELKKQIFCIDVLDMFNGLVFILYMVIIDEMGNFVVLEYIDGNLIIYEGKEYQVMINLFCYDLQLVVNDYWKEVGGLNMLLGINCLSDCFVCVFFYIYVILQILDVKIVVLSVLSVMCNVFVFFGIMILDKFYIFFICWCLVFD